MRFKLKSLLLFVAAVSIALTAYRWWPIDGVISNLLAIRSEEDTVWADGYTDEAWRSVRIDMKRDEVYALLGLPLVKDIDGGNAHECWTRSPADTDFFQRSLQFKGDTVICKWNRFFFLSIRLRIIK